MSLHCSAPRYVWYTSQCTCITTPSYQLIHLKRFRREHHYRVPPHALHCCCDATLCILTHLLPHKITSCTIHNNNKLFIMAISWCNAFVLEFTLGFAVAEESFKHSVYCRALFGQHQHQHLTNINFNITVRRYRFTSVLTLSIIIGRSDWYQYFNQVDSAHLNRLAVVTIG